MKTDRLEDFIKANREAFDQMEPSGKVWEKISDKQPKTRVIKLKSFWFRAAAVAMIVVATSVILVKTDLLNGQKIAAETDPELRELLEAEAFYAHQVNGKLEEIRKCYYTYPELKDDIENDLNELQLMYNELKTDLKENVSNKTVIEAMIENNRIRLKLVDQVLDQINC